MQKRVKEGEMEGKTKEAKEGKEKRKKQFLLVDLIIMIAEAERELH
jgi:hypothetical protein